jgi:hypothetical protein
MKRIRVVFAAAICALAWSGLSVATAVAHARIDSSTARSCQQGAYKSSVGAHGTTVANVGACASSVADGGEFATGLILSAGEIATLSGASFGDFTTNCPGDPLAYGYQLNLGKNVQIASGTGCTHIAGATIGPFKTAKLLRIWLNDFAGPGYIFYSDGSHALVSGSNPWTFSITDSFFGTKGSSIANPPAGPGKGNLNVTVAISCAPWRKGCLTLARGAREYGAGAKRGPR